MNRRRSIALLLLVLLVMTFLLAACQPPLGDPYELGQWVRQQLDQLLQDVQEFLAGFCGAPVASSVLGAVAVAWLVRKKG